MLGTGILTGSAGRAQFELIQAMDAIIVAEPFMKAFTALEQQMIVSLDKLVNLNPLRTVPAITAAGAKLVERVFDMGF